MRLRTALSVHCAAKYRITDRITLTAATVQIIPKSRYPRDWFKRLPKPRPVASHSAIITPSRARGAVRRTAAKSHGTEAGRVTRRISRQPVAP